MSKRKSPPSTSIDAYHSLQPEHLAEIYRKILEALGKLGFATYEEIASYLKLAPSKVWKRMSELHAKGLVYRPGTKKMLKSNRMGYQWGLTSESLPKVEKKPEKALPGKPVHEYAKSINQIARQGGLF